MDNFCTLNDLFEFVKSNSYYRRCSLDIYQQYRKHWNKTIVNNERKMILKPNIGDIYKLMDIISKEYTRNTIDKILIDENIEDITELIMRINTMFFWGDLMFCDYRYENKHFVYYNPTYTKKDGYNYIDCKFENMRDWEGLWKECLIEIHKTEEDYPLKEYAKDNGYISIEEYRADYLYI